MNGFPRLPERRALSAVAAALATAIATAATAVVAFPAIALAASPLPTAVESADLRSSGQGAGPAGNPIGAVYAVIAVLAIGLVAAALTLAYIRVSDRRRAAPAGASTGPGATAGNDTPPPAVPAPRDTGRDARGDGIEAAPDAGARDVATAGGDRYRQ